MEAFVINLYSCTASHLIHCKRKIAYYNAEKAAQYSVQMQSASFPTLVNLDDGEQDSNEASDKWLRALVKPPDNDDTKPKRSAISEFIILICFVVGD